MAYKYIAREGLVTAVNTFTLLTLNELAAAQPAERMPSTASRIVQILFTANARAPDLGTEGGAGLIRLTGGCLEHGEESIPTIGANSEGLVAESTGRPMSVQVMDVDIPVKGNELINIGWEQVGGTILGSNGWIASVTLVVEY